MKHKKLITIISIITTLIIFIILLFFKYFKSFESQAILQPEKIVEIEILQKTDIQQTADFIGTIRSNQQTILTAKTKGILNINAKPGQILKKGEIIASIENENLEHNYKLLKETKEIAELQLNRAQSLLKSGVSTKHDVEEKRTILLEAQKKLSDAKIILEDIKIYAPFDGTVGLFKFRGGSQVNSSDVIVNFYDPKSLIVEFDVPLSIAKQVHDGGDMLVNHKPYHLTHIQKMLDEDTHMCPAYSEIDCPDCVIGTTVDVSLITQQKKSVIVIPFEAIFLKEGKPFVYTVTANKATLIPVQLGIKNKNLIEISSGLKENDQLIVQGHNRLYPDAAVKIHNRDHAK